jgi:hypothetical protein
MWDCGGTQVDRGTRKIRRYELAARQVGARFTKPVRRGGATRGAEHRLLTLPDELGRVASRFGPLAPPGSAKQRPRDRHGLQVSHRPAGAAHLENGIEDEKASAGEHSGFDHRARHGNCTRTTSSSRSLRATAKTATWTVPVGERAAAPTPALRIVRLAPAVAKAAWAGRGDAHTDQRPAGILSGVPVVQRFRRRV